MLELKFESLCLFRWCMVVLPPRFLLFYPIQNDHWCPWLVTVKPLLQSWSQTCNVQSLTHFISIYFAINVKKKYTCKQIHWILSSILIIPYHMIYFLNTRILAFVKIETVVLPKEVANVQHLLYWSTHSINLHE